MIQGGRWPIMATAVCLRRRAVFLVILARHFILSPISEHVGDRSLLILWVKASRNLEFYHIVSVLTLDCNVCWVSCLLHGSLDGTRVVSYVLSLVL